MHLVASITIFGVYVTIAATALGQPNHSRRGQLNGVEIEAKLTHEQIMGSARWDPNTQSKPPVGLSEAIRIARQSLVKQYPELKDTRFRYHVSLEEWSSFLNEHVLIGSPRTTVEGSVQTIAPGKWFIYWITFRDSGFRDFPESRKHSDGRVDAVIDSRRLHVPVAVLMDRTCSVAIVTSDSEPSDAPKDRASRIDDGKPNAGPR